MVQRGRIALAGNEYIVSVTGMPFCCINRTDHSVELATSGGHPLSGCAGLSPIQGREYNPSMFTLDFICYEQHYGD